MRCFGANDYKGEDDIGAMVFHHIVIDGAVNSACTLPSLRLAKRSQLLLIKDNSQITMAPQASRPALHRNVTSKLIILH